MVSPELIAAASAVTARKVLVTGGSGFLGSRIALTLAAAGHSVVACGRNPYRIPFPVGGPVFKRADLSDRETIINLCCDRDVVIHAGALTKIWGDSVSFQQANVDGTQNVIDGCLQHNVARLVHVSSTAVQFDFREQEQVVESDPLPTEFACHYAWSKAEAEKRVQAAVRNQQLNAVIIRARALFGEGDNSLLPRLLQVADQGRLRQIGSASTQIDLTYIDNQVLAVILAIANGPPGAIYTITNDEPIKLWPFIKNLLQQTGRSPKLRFMSRNVALQIAGIAARVYRWRATSTEPPLTRYSVGLLSTTKTFNISAAKRDLNYRPVVSMSEGAERVIKGLLQRDENHAKTLVKVQLFTTGYTTAKSHLVERGGSRNQSLRLHALIALLDHPHHGLTLFDTGYSPRFFAATERWPYRLYRQFTPVVTDWQHSAKQCLETAGIDPHSVQRIVLSHFHADHVGGLHDFPQADVIASSRCWDSVRGRAGLAALKRAYLPDLIPADLANRLFLVEHFHDPGFGAFPTSHDLFADGSVRMLDLSGHAPGQIGLLVQRGPQDRVLLAADAAWTSRAVHQNLKPTLAFRMLADSTKALTQTQRRLHDIQARFPDVEIIPTHCPDVAVRYGFDRGRINE